MDTIKVKICEHTGEKVLMKYTEDGWLCLHKDTKEEDAISVEAFEAGMGN